MLPLERSGAIPSAPDGDPFLAEWYRARTADGAVAAVDRLLSARMEDGAVTARECDAFLQRNDVAPELLTFARHDCAALIRQEKLTSAVDPPVDRSSPGALRATIDAATYDDPGAAREDLLRSLDGALSGVTSHEGRALLLASESGIADGAAWPRDLDLAALHEDPKVVDGTVLPWDRLLFASKDTTSAPLVAAWIPWSTHAMAFCAGGAGDLADMELFARREVVLSQSSLWLGDLADTLLNVGKREEARAVAARAKNEGLRVRVEAADGRFGAALAIARDAIAAFPATRPGASKAFYLAQGAAGVSLVLERPLDWMAPLVDRYLDPSSEAMTSGGIPFYGAIVACTFAPRDVAARCFRKLRALSAPVAGYDALEQAGERFSQGDYAGAARAFRPLLAKPNMLLYSLRDAAAVAFERTGEPDLAERVDKPTLAATGSFNGVDLAWVRAAKRAEKRGDRETARKLAEQVVEAWSTADEAVPAVAEMRALLARLH
jgi:hypothetical protein